jgi:hypothetical protein
MSENQDPSSSQPKPGYGVDLLLALLLFAGAFGVRWLYADQVVFPPLGKSAFFLTTGENVVTGRGLEVDVLWNYQPSFPGVTHPSHERWMPLTTGLMAAAFAAQRAISGTLEASLQTGQLPGLILGAMLAALTYLVGRRVLPGGSGHGLSSEKGSLWVSLAAALLIALNPTLGQQSASASSSAALALLGAWALSYAVRKPGDQGGYFAAGLLVALAYLASTSALLLLVAIPLAWFLLPLPPRLRTEFPDNPAAEVVWEHWPRERGRREEWPQIAGPRLLNILDLAVAFVLVIALWLARNYLAFGTPLPSSVLEHGWLSNRWDLFNYLSPPTWQTWLAQDWQTLLDLRGQALLHNGQVLLGSTLAWGLLALPGLWLLRREWSFFPALVYGLVLFFGLALVFPVSSMAGAFDHSLGVVMPFLALAALYAIERAVKPFSQHRKLAVTLVAGMTIALLTTAGFLLERDLPATGDASQAQQAQFQAAADWLTQHAAAGTVIMTSETYILNYASGHPTIALPGNEPPEAAWKAAQRYGARYLVITEPCGQYPQILQEQPDPRFRLVAEIKDTQIYEIGGGQP